MDNQEFRNYLRGLREKRHLTLEQVELKSGIVNNKPGITNGYLSQIETGTRGKPSAKKLAILAPIYKVPIEELMFNAGYLSEYNPIESTPGFSAVDEWVQEFKALPLKEQKKIYTDLTHHLMKDDEK